MPVLPTFILAYAQQTDLSDSGMKVVLISLAALAVAGVLALIAMAVARTRVPRWSQGVMAAAVVWAMILVASVIQTMLAQMHWSGETDILLKSGYYDPAQAPPAPGYPVVLWGILAVAYVLGLLAMVMLWQKDDRCNPDA